VSGALERFLEAARARGVVPDVKTFPEGTRTADDAARAVGCEVDRIVKSLVFIADGKPVVALTSGRHRVDTDKLARLCGASEVRRASPEEAREATGFAVGGTPPFGHPSPIRTFIDPHLMGFASVWVAAGRPDSVFPLEPGRLAALSGASEADFVR
jgi:Cys-tRNA(Pro) deacylase